MTASPGAPAGTGASLLLTEPPEIAGRTLPLSVGRNVLGRDVDVDLRLDVPHVSRHHAQLLDANGVLYIDDLGSSGGTFVNGHAVTTPEMVRVGDVVRFATVEALVIGESSSPAPAAVVHDPRAAGREPVSIGRQYGETINNVDGDQHITIQQIEQKRASFAEAVAATRTKARVMLWLGAILLVAGFAVYAFVIVDFIRRVPELGPETDPSSVDLFGPEVGGFPIGLWAFFAAMAGMFLLAAGIIGQVIATAKRRRFNRELPPSHQL